MKLPTRFVTQCSTLKLLALVFIQICCIGGNTYAQTHQEISKEVLSDKIEAYWYGQLVGNYMEFPFENIYKEEPIPILIDRYFTVKDLESYDLKMNVDDRQAYGHIMAETMGGAWSDDDTDIEFVTLPVEKYGETIYEVVTGISVVPQKNDVKRLRSLLKKLEKKEDNRLLKKHYASVRIMIEDKTHDVAWSKQDSLWASNVLDYFLNEGAVWETYSNGPRPLIMSYKSPSDGKNSFYWLFLPKEFDNTREDYSFYLELHGSGGGKNDNPRNMLFRPIQPQIKGVTTQGYRKEGLFIYPWGRGDKGYKGQSEKDIFETIAHFDQMFTTDRTRQYLFGFSMGGGGAFRFAQKTLDRWSALGIYSGTLNEVSLEEAKKFQNMPIWMAWGEKERLAEGNRKLKDYLLSIGAQIQWTEIPNVGHSYLGAYQSDLMDWFLEHQK